MKKRIIGGGHVAPGQVRGGPGQGRGAPGVTGGSRAPGPGPVRPRAGLPPNLPAGRDEGPAGP